MNIISQVTIPQLLFIDKLLGLIFIACAIGIFIYNLVKAIKNPKFWNLIGRILASTLAGIFLFIVIGIMATNWNETVTITKISYSEYVPIGELREKYNYIEYNHYDNTFTLKEYSDQN